MAGFAQLSYSLENLTAVIRANREPISIDSLLKGFGIPLSKQHIIINGLRQLKESGIVEGVGERAYKAARPWPDVAVARVVNTERGSRGELKIEGVAGHPPFPITISEKQVKQHRLKKNDRLYVRLTRHNGVELRVSRCITKLSYKKNPIITGRFNQAADGSISFISSDKTIKTAFAVTGRVPDKIAKDQIFVAVIPGRVDMENPSVEVAEQRWDPVTGNKIAHIIAQKHGLLIRHNDDALLSAAKTARQKIDSANRRIIREPILVVDPINSPGDFDDGIYAEYTPDKLIRTMTVVTDVASYIPPHSRLDKYALERARSYYFPKEREFFHMVPEQLSLKKMALRQGHPHPVIYNEQFWDPSTGELIESRTGLGLSVNHRNLNYHQFQMMLDSDGPDMAAYKKFDEIAWARDSEDNIQLPDRQLEEDQAIRQAKDIVQAMMIRACVTMAEQLENSGVLYMRRNHAGHYNNMAYNEAAQPLREWGFYVPYDARQLDPATINGILLQAEARDNAYEIKQYVRSNLIYRADYSLQTIGHFGNNTAYYGHFTSPIRRYADLFNQRAYHTAFGNPVFGLSDEMQDLENAQKVVDHLNMVDQRALIVERDSDRYYGIRDLQMYEGQKLTATLHNIHKNGNIEILLQGRHGIRAMIAPEQLPHDWEIANNSRGLVFEGRGYFGVGSTVRIKLGNVFPEKAQWHIDDIEPRSMSWIKEREQIPALERHAG